MKIVNGDLIQLAKQGEFDVIIHGCNCFCTMSSGIAKSIKYYFPEAYYADKSTIKGDKNKLGDFSYASIKRNNINLVVVNAYTQYEYGLKNQLYTSYIAINKIFKSLSNSFAHKFLKIAYPKIGCGLGGGEWSIVSSIIDKNFNGLNHTLVIKN